MRTQSMGSSGAHGRVFVEKPALLSSLLRPDPSEEQRSNLSPPPSRNGVSRSAFGPNSRGGGRPPSGYGDLASNSQVSFSAQGSIASSTTPVPSRGGPRPTRPKSSSRLAASGREATTSHVDLKKLSRKDEDLDLESALEARRERREARLPKLLSKVDDAKKFLDTIERDMNMVEEAHYNKLRRQFEDWNVNVHGQIQAQIQAQIDSVDSRTLNRKNNSQFNKFLDITNKKPAIFRDIIIESEYDPLEPNRKTIKAKTKWLKDPAKLSIQKATEEANMLTRQPGKPSGGIPKAKTREVLDVKQWAAGKVEATPYGTFARMMDPNASHAEMSSTMKSSVHFDHFNYPKDKQSMDAELPRGKRTFPMAIASDSRRIFGGE